MIVMKAEGFPNFKIKAKQKLHKMSISYQLNWVSPPTSWLKREGNSQKLSKEIFATKMLLSIAVLHAWLCRTHLHRKLLRYLAAICQGQPCINNGVQCTNRSLAPHPWPCDNVGFSSANMTCKIHVIPAWWHSCSSTTRLLFEVKSYALLGG